MEITVEEIQKRFSELPEDIRWAIMAAQVDDNLIIVGQNQGLTVEQMGQVSLETHMVILGFTPPEKFAESLKGSLQLSDDRINSIVEEVNNKILKGIRAKMMKAETKPEENDAPTIKPTMQIEEHETNILNTAGIKILDPNTLELKAGEIKRPILANKLNGSFQIPTIKTEHTPENISKPTTTIYPPKADPYRLAPED